MSVDKLPTFSPVVWKKHGVATALVMAMAVLWIVAGVVLVVAGISTDNSWEAVAGVVAMTAGAVQLTLPGYETLAFRRGARWHQQRINARLRELEADGVTELWQARMTISNEMLDPGQP